MTEIDHADYAAAATLRAALRRFGSESSRILRGHGLTTERYELLLAIEARSDGSRRATTAELAEDLRLASSSMTQLARRAEDAGLICRSVSREDGRVRYLALTEAGGARLREAATELGPERRRLITLLRALDGSTPELRPAALA